MDADYSFDRDVLDAPQMPFFYRLLIMLTIIAAVSLLIVYANQERNLKELEKSDAGQSM